MRSTCLSLQSRVAGALRSTCAALVAKHNSSFRAAGVAVLEMRFRVPDSSGAWRVVVSSPTGQSCACTQLFWSRNSTDTHEA